jgi:inner membrane protein
MAGVASHLALDWTNIYGVRLLLPFSGEWLRADTTGVIDIWIWAALLLGIAAPFLARLVHAEIGSPAQERHPDRGFAMFALTFLLLYNGGRMLLHERAVATLESRLYNGVQPFRVAALPSLFNPLRWRGLVETHAFYSVHDVDLLDEFEPTRGAVFHKFGSDPAVEAAKRTRAFQVFLQFSQFPYVRVLPADAPEGGRRVEAMDLRFGTPRQPAFVAVAELNSRLEVIDSWFDFGSGPPR